MKKSVIFGAIAVVGVAATIAVIRKNSRKFANVTITEEDVTYESDELTENVTDLTVETRADSKTQVVRYTVTEDNARRVDMQVIDRIARYLGEAGDCFSHGDVAGTKMAVEEAAALSSNTFNPIVGLNGHIPGSPCSSLSVQQRIEYACDHIALLYGFQAGTIHGDVKREFELKWDNFLGKFRVVRFTV